MCRDCFDVRLDLGELDLNPLIMPDSHATVSAIPSLLGRVSSWQIAVVLWFAFATLYSLLRSLDFTAVDGAVRAAEVLHRGELFFHGNNHLLYPFNVWLWNGALALIGLGSADPIGYIRDTQVMNALAGAGCVSIVFAIGARLSEARLPALIGALVFGFSRVALLHFTNSAEPTVGLFWSLATIGVLLAGLERGSRWLIVLSGALLGLALATYQGMFFMGGIAVALCLCWNTLSGDRTSMAAGVAERIALFTLGGLIVTTIAFGCAYEFSGVTGLGPKINRLFTIEGGDHVFGGFTVSKLVNAPIGFVASLLPALPSDYSGLRSLLARTDSTERVVALLMAALPLAAILPIAIYRSLRRISPHHPFRGFGSWALYGGLVITLFPVLYWEPLYDKLWLLPLSVLAFLVPVGLKGVSTGLSLKILRLFGAVLLTSVVVLNLSWAIPASRVRSAEVDSALEVLRIVQPNDLVICDWDGVSSLYKALADSRYDVIDFPSTVGQRGVDGIPIVEGRIRLARERGGRVYFLGVLDQSAEDWDLFLGNRVGVPYEALDAIRRQSKPILILASNRGPISLWLVG